jgi:hypothetical protein
MRPASCTAAEEFPNISLNKVHHRVNKSPPLVHILSQINTIHTTPSYISKIHLILSIQLYFGLPSFLFPTHFHMNNLHVSLLFKFMTVALPISSSITS